MNSWKNILTKNKYLIIGIGLTILGTAVFLFLPNSQPKKVFAVPVTKQDLLSVISASGRLDSESTAYISSEIDGELKTLFVHEGELVTKNRLLGIIENKKIEEALDKAKVSMQFARYDLVSLKSEYEQSQQLFKAKAISAKDLASSKISYEKYQQQSIKEAERTLADAIKDKEKTKFYAPFDGTIVQQLEGINKRIGNSARLLRIADLKRLIVVLDVDEFYIQQIRLDLPVQITGRTLGDNILKGHVKHIGKAVIDRNRRKIVEVVCSVETTSTVPKLIDATVLGEIELSRKNQVLTVPLESIMLEGNVSNIFVVEKGIAQRKGITTGMRGQDRIEIKSGIKLGDQVIVQGNIDLKNGQPVVVVQTEEELYSGLF